MTQDNQSDQGLDEALKGLRNDLDQLSLSPKIADLVRQLRAALRKSDASPN